MKTRVNVQHNHIAAGKRGDLYSNPIGIAMQDVFPGRGLFWLGTDDRKKKIAWDQVFSHSFRPGGGMNPNSLMFYRVSDNAAIAARRFYMTGQCKPMSFDILEMKKVKRTENT